MNVLTQLKCSRARLFFNMLLERLVVSIVSITIVFGGISLFSYEIQESLKITSVNMLMWLIVFFCMSMTRLGVSIVKHSYSSSVFVVSVEVFCSLQPRLGVTSLMNMLTQLKCSSVEQFYKDLELA